MVADLNVRGTHLPTCACTKIVYSVSGTWRKSTWSKIYYYYGYYTTSTAV